MDKRIRIDYYRFRIRKGQADVLLQKEAAGRYCVPFRYVQKKERVGPESWFRNIEDDGDLVINDIKLNDCHLKKEDREWIPLDGLPGLSLGGNESFHTLHNILRFFLSVCPREEESAIFGKAETMLDEVLARGARKKYMDMLQGLLEGKQDYLDAYLTPADPALIRREMETLEHFRLKKPERETADLARLYEAEYAYEPVDPKIFGCTLKMIPLSGPTSLIVENP